MAKAALGLGAFSIVLALIGLGSPVTAAYGMFFGMLGFLFGAFSLPKEEAEGEAGNMVAVILPAVAIICSAVIGLL